MLWLLDRFEDGQAVLDQALTRTRELGASHLLSRLLYTAGTISFGRGDFRDAMKLHEEALAVAQGQGDLEGEAWARHGLCETMYFLGPFEQGLAQGREADRLLRQLGQRPMVYHNQYMIGFLLWQSGRLEEAIPVADEALAGAREVGDRRNEGFALAGRFMATQSEDPAAALQALEQTLQISRDLNTPRLEAATLGFGADLLMDLGQTAQARAQAEQAMALTEGMQSTFAKGRLFALLGWADVREERIDRARERFAQARLLAEGILTEELIGYRAEMLAWDDAALEGELADAAGRLRESAAGESPNFLAWAHYGLARAAILRGDARETAEQAARAIELAEESRERGAEWRARHVLATALESQGNVSDAAEEARRAARWVEALTTKLTPDLRPAFEELPLVREVLRARARLSS